MIRPFVFPVLRVAPNVFAVGSIGAAKPSSV